MKHLITEELITLVKELLYDFLHTLYYNSQTGIRCVVYNVVAQILWDILQEEGICETLDAHKAKFFETYAVANRLSKNLLPSSSFMTTIATFL